MNESMKDKFLKEHALNDDDLEKVSGGDGVTVPEWLRLDGSFCREDCCGVHDRDSCGYTFCKWSRW